MDSTMAIAGERSALLSAVDWIVRAMLGSAGTAIAVLAIALIGLAMLQGRFAVRDGFRAVLGCFILFGAPAIARGLLEASQSSAVVQESAGRQAPPSSPPIPAHAPQFDPYAGASTPM